MLDSLTKVGGVTFRTQKNAPDVDHHTGISNFPGVHVYTEHFNKHSYSVIQMARVTALLCKLRAMITALGQIPKGSTRDTLNPPICTSQPKQIAQ